MLVDQALGQAALELTYWVGYNLTIGDNTAVHAVVETTDSAGRAAVMPGCSIGWNGTSTTRFKRTDRAVTCGRSGCAGSGASLPTPKPGAQGELFGPDALARFA